MNQAGKTNADTLWTIDQGQGPVVVLVHGFPLDHRMWQRQIDALSKHHRVLAPDLPGFGRSDLPPDAKLEMDCYAQSLAELLDSKGIDEPVHLAGFSMGGYIALAFSRKYADRLASLMLIDTKAAPDTPEAAKGRDELAKKVMETGTQVAAEAMMPKLFSQVTHGRQPEVEDRVNEIMLDQSPEAVATALGAMARRPDSTPGLAKLDIPVLLIVGQEDAITPPAEMKKVAGAIKDAKLVTIAGAGHMTTLEKPGDVDEAMLAFLNSLD